jgi:hypothetical protein
MKYYILIVCIIFSIITGCTKQKEKSVTSKDNANISMKKESGKLILIYDKDSFKNNKYRKTLKITLDNRENKYIFKNNTVIDKIDTGDHVLKLNIGKTFEEIPIHIEKDTTTSIKFPLYTSPLGQCLQNIDIDGDQLKKMIDEYVKNLEFGALMEGYYSVTDNCNNEFVQLIGSRQIDSALLKVDECISANEYSLRMVSNREDILSGFEKAVDEIRLAMESKTKSWQLAKSLIENPVDDGTNSLESGSNLLMASSCRN